MLLLFTFPSSRGADVNDQFAIKGIGLRPCGDYVQARRGQTPQYFQFGGWMEGYLTASNRFEEETFDLAPWQSSGVLAAWLQRFCERNPDAEFVRAVGALINALGQDRLQLRSELLEFEVGGETGYIYTEVLRRAQRSLAARGLYQGPVDGALSAETQRALRQFQRQADLEETGVPEQETLVKLLQ